VNGRLKVKPVVKVQKILSRLSLVKKQTLHAYAVVLRRYVRNEIRRTIKKRREIKTNICLTIPGQQRDTRQKPLCPTTFGCTLWTRLRTYKRTRISSYDDVGRCDAFGFRRRILIEPQLHRLYWPTKVYSVYEVYNTRSVFSTRFDRPAIRITYKFGRTYENKKLD